MPHKTRRHKIGELDELSLVPIMSILVILIPMLIYAFTFFKVTVQSVAAPKMGTGKAKPKETKDQKKPLNLTVLVSDSDFRIKYDDELMAGQSEPPIKRTTFPGDKFHGGAEYVDYDYAQLYNRLMAIKAKFPNEEQINIGAEMYIPWHVIAATIDASRVQLEGGPFTEEDRMLQFFQAKAKKNKKDGTSVFLFPNVVFVVAE